MTGTSMAPVGVLGALAGDGAQRLGAEPKTGQGQVVADGAVQDQAGLAVVLGAPAMRSSTRVVCVTTRVDAKHSWPTASTADCRAGSPGMPCRRYGLMSLSVAGL